MIQMVIAGLLVIAVVYGAMLLNTAAPHIFAFIVGFAAGAFVIGPVGLWLFQGSGPRL